MLRSFRPTRPAPALGLLALASVLGGLTLAVAPAAGATPVTRYVAKTGTDGADSNCTVRAHPCRTVAAATARAGNGDTIVLGPGTFAESFDILAPLTIIGSTQGTTTLTGNPSANSPIVVVQSQATLRHLHLAADSGGISLDTGSAVIEDVTITGTGGGVFVDDSSGITIRDSAIVGHGPSGVTSLGGVVSIAHSTVSGARPFTSNGRDVGGYGIEVVGGGGSTTITDSAITGNDVAGILVDYVPDGETPLSTLSVRDSTVSGNSQAGIANGPGGVATVENSTIADNGGAGVVTQSSVTTVRNSTITDTFADTTAAPTTDGPGQAGIVALPPEPANANARTPAARTVFAGAERASDQPAQAAAASDETVVKLSGTIVAKNSSLPDCVGTVVDEGYNLSSDAANSCNFDPTKHSLTAADPKLGPLADNGGATKTLLPGAGSAALDVIPAGSAGCVAGAKDQRGLARPQPAAGRCDIGAVEVATPILIGGSALPHGTVGRHYRHAFTATGGADATYVWTLATGSDRPAGLTFSHSGVLSGVPTKAGTFSVTVSVNDPVVKTFALVIDAAPAPNVVHSDPLANSGAQVTGLSITGGSAVGVGLLLLLGAGLVRRRPGRHRAG